MAHVCQQPPDPATLPALLWHSVVIDRGGRDAPRVLPQVVDDVPARRRPRSDSATTVASAGVSNQSCGKQRIASPQKVRNDHLPYEGFLGVTLDMNEQSRHPVLSLPTASRVGRPPNSFFSQSWPRL